MKIIHNFALGNAAFFRPRGQVACVASVRFLAKGSKKCLFKWQTNKECYINTRLANRCSLWGELLDVG